MQYLERVIKESLRILPSVPLIMRNFPEEGDFCGKQLPAGTTLVINILGLHRDPRHWPDPLTFDPDRFLPERSEGRHPYCYLPFSAGSRDCIGKKYAMMQMKVLLATMLRTYRVLPTEDGISHPSQVRLSSALGSFQVGGTRVRFERRTGS